MLSINQANCLKFEFLNPSLEFTDCPTSSANKIDHQLFSNHFYKTFCSNSACKSLLPWLYRSPICLSQPSFILSSNAPCPKEVLFPKFN
ncbi:unnamed protein product [Schistosoma rodhaini]|nr:unnamed protein product [Schistosoma rodhaini]